MNGMFNKLPAVQCGTGTNSISVQLAKPDNLIKEVEETLR
jgi:hypothetical protein